MGGGDLNLKKSWHPLTLRNLEKVWLAEQAADKEKQKVEQLRREKVLEKSNEDLKAIQKGSSNDKGKLDWMYSGSASTANSIQESFLLGKKKIELNERANDDKVLSSGLVNLGPSWKNASACSDGDLESKIREDPLMLIRKREVEKNRKSAPLKKAAHPKSTKR